MSRDGSDLILAQLDRLIGGLDGSIQQEAGRAWIEQDATPEARRLVPVLTGATRDSIGGEAGAGGIVMFATTSYAEDLEKGTSRMAARPYLAPAMRAKLSLLANHLTSAIDRRKQ